MKSTTIVFRGCDQVLEAYEANNVAPWAIINAGVVLCADNPESVDEGKKMLEETLRRLQMGNSRASFDFAVYKIRKDQEITMKTEIYRGFRFTLYGDDEMTPYESGRRMASTQFDQRLAAQQKEIDELKAALAAAEEESGDEKPDGIGGILSGLLENPAVKQALSIRLIGLIDKIVPMGAAQRPAAVAGVPGQSLLDADQQQKVQQAVNILCTKDAKLGDHLLSVANIALNNPGQYSMLIGMLK